LYLSLIVTLNLCFIKFVYIPSFPVFNSISCNKSYFLFKSCSDQKVARVLISSSVCSNVFNICGPLLGHYYVVYLVGVFGAGYFPCSFVNVSPSVPSAQDLKLLVVAYAFQHCLH